MSRDDDKALAREFAQDAELNGNPLKAIALFRQVFRLDPERIDVLEKIATLYEEVGFDEEANSYLRSAHSAFLYAGRHDDAREMARRLAERGIDLRPVARA